MAVSPALMRSAAGALAIENCCRLRVPLGAAEDYSTNGSQQKHLHPACSASCCLITVIAATRWSRACRSQTSGEDPRASQREAATFQVGMHRPASHESTYPVIPSPPKETGRRFSHAAVIYIRPDADAVTCSDVIPQHSHGA